MRDLAVPQYFRQDAEDRRSGGKRRIRDRAHEPEGSPAVDQAAAALTEELSQARGFRAVLRSDAVGGAAEDGDASRLHG